MSSFVNYALPAGDESDASNEEWDIDHSDKKSSSITALDAVELHSKNDVLLKRAISEGDTGTVEQLLNNGMDVETKCGFEWTPLMCAVSMANYDLARLLLDRGASANFSKDHWTVLMTCCTATGSEDNIAHCVALLLSRNADPNMVDSSRMTALMLAARKGYSKVINLLVSFGADPNVQNDDGYTALSIAAQHGNEKAVLKLLQLGADKTIQTTSGKNPLELATTYKHTQIARILSSSTHISNVQASSSTEDMLSRFFKTNVNTPSSTENVTKLDDLELLLHGLDLGYLIDTMTENNITWGDLLTMEEEDLEKIGITDPEEQQKVLRAAQQMHIDQIDLNTLGQLGVDCGSEELHNFLISVRQQCCYLTQTIQDVISRFPCKASQIVFSLDPKKEARAVCNQLLIQTNDLETELTCLRNMLCQVDQAADCCELPQPHPDTSWSTWYLSRGALAALGATALVILYKAARPRFT